MSVEGGRRILGGRYELQERIASGGMGEVWRGRDVVLKRIVAVKVLRSEYADDPTFVARFRGEARHAAALSHPNIAAVLDYGEASQDEAGEHLAYLVMELVEGAPLSTLLAEDGPMEPGAALSVLQQTAAGLAEAHRRGLVHRDVKPANILVRPDGGVKLTDFGIARSADSVPLTGTGQVVGTAQYMSPEQAKGETATPASDVYALGLVGYESLTGHAAFEGTNPVAVALKHVVEEPQPLPPGLPDEVRDLIDSALAKDPEERIPDGAAFLSAVEDTLAPESGHSATGPDTRAIGPDTRPVGVPGRAGAVRAPLPAPPRPRRRTLAVLLPLLVLFVAVGVFAVLAVTHGGRDGADDGTSAAADTGIVLTADDHLGQQYERVAADLEDLGLVVVRVEQVSDQPPGTVLEISPAGTRLAEGDQVRVVAAVPPVERDAPETVEVPAPVLVEDEQPAPVADPPAAPGTVDAPAPSESVPPVETSLPPSSTEPEPSVPGTTPPGTTAPTDPTTPTDPTGPTDPTPPTEPTTPGDTSEPPVPDPGAPSEPAPADPAPTTTSTDTAPTQPAV